MTTLDEAHPGQTWISRGPKLVLQDTNIWDAIARGLLRHPERTCLKCADVTLTPPQLLDALNALANQLPLNSQTQRVGIHVSRSAASVVATLALWKSGCIYVPLPVEYPSARIDAIAKSCNLDLIIIDRPLAVANYDVSIVLKLLNKPLYCLTPKRAVSVDRSADLGICYIAHTSGSTGAAKGVKISHRALINRIASMTRFLRTSESDVCLYKTPLSFDVHIWEFVLPLASGSSLVIYPVSEHVDLLSVAKLICTEGVTILGFAPSLLNLVLDIDPFIKGNKLRAVLCGGEAWAPALAKKFYSKLPGRKLYNSYGPTETTIAVANWPVPDQELDRICLGEPLDNLIFMIEETERVNGPEGEDIIGILCIGGAQVGDGYVNPEHDLLFFSKVVDGEHARFYRTGDRVRLDPRTGLAAFVGRDDNQIKIHGMRMELEEIKSVIARIDPVESCVVVLIRSGATPRLHASFRTLNDAPLNIETLKEECQRVLPKTFVPFWFKQVKAFPLRDNGKIDRVAIVNGIEAELSSLQS